MRRLIRQEDVQSTFVLLSRPHLCGYSLKKKWVTAQCKYNQAHDLLHQELNQNVIYQKRPFPYFWKYHICIGKSVLRYHDWSTCEWLCNKYLHITTSYFEFTSHIELTEYYFFLVISCVSIEGIVIMLVNLHSKAIKILIIYIYFVKLSASVSCLIFPV